MSTPRWTRIKQIFAYAIRLGKGPLRDAFIEEQCEDHPSLLADIRSLLRHHDEKGSFLQAPTSVSGKRLLHYEVVGPLGEGGMGVAYKARDTRLNRWVTLKLLPAWMAPSPKAKQRLLREAQCASAPNHPNIVTVHDVASDNGIDFIVMEYVPGPTLHQLLATDRMNIHRALQYAIQIAGALVSAHAASVVHGDLKPANIVITPKDQVKLLDFSLARVLHGEHPSKAEDAKLRGTPGYVAPEQSTGILDHRSDIFSFGAVLYEMLTGRRAFLDQEAHWNANNTRYAQDVFELLQIVPPELRGVVVRCLELNPQNRYHTAQELEDELRTCAKHIGTALVDKEPD